MQYRVLLVDDEPVMLEATRNKLEKCGYAVDVARGGDEAVAKFKEGPERYALVILDYQMPGKNGGVVAEELLAISPQTYILFYSGAVNANFKAGHVEVLGKDASPEVFLKTVENWCHKYDQTTRILLPNGSLSENEQLIRSVGMLGRSNALAGIARQIVRLEREGSDHTILITGENGTGKEVVAKAIHKHSRRRNHALVSVNCGAIPENLVESELFGHERGSFTGADQKKIGKFQFAHHGTIFLDELGETSLASQVKLLRVLQEREITPVGANHTTPVNVRVIAATNRDLEEAIRQKTFREDLYYRLKVITIHVPPLRERPEDIEPLLAYFCAKDNEYYKRNRAFLMSAVRLLERYSWPGNVRELENAVYALLAGCDGNRVRPDDIDGRFWARNSPQAESYYQLKQRHEEEERLFLQALLSSTESQRESARKIEMEYSTFRDKLKRLGLLNGGTASPASESNPERVQ